MLATLLENQMTWEKHEPESSGGQNVNYAVYSETVVDSHDKTLDIDAGLGSLYVLKPTFIEIIYTAFNGGLARDLELIIARDGIDVHTLRLDKSASPKVGMLTRIYLARGRDVVVTEIKDGDPTFVHTMAPFVLSSGDVMRIHSPNGMAQDQMSLFFHCETLSR
jgi:hypothetical protein